MLWPLSIFVLIAQIWCFKCEKVGKCVPKNVTLFYTGSIRDIESVRHTSSYFEPFKHLPSIYTYSKVKSIAYDPTHREILFVEELKTRQIQGVHRTIRAHIVVDQEEFEFGKIAVDTITGNIYFLNAAKGIGICSGHGNGSRCMLLIELNINGEVELAVHARRGLIFWLQRNQAGNSFLQIAGTDGRHIRQLSTDGQINSMYLDSSADSLYIAYESRIARIDLNTFGQEWISYDYTSKFIYWNCNLYYLGWKYSKGHALRFYGENRYKLIKENVNAIDSMFLLPDDEQRLDQNPCSQLSCPDFCVLTEAAPQLRAKCIQTSSTKSTDREEIQVTTAYFTLSFLVFSASSLDTKTELTERNENSIIFYILIALIILAIIVMICAYIKLRPDTCSRIKRVFGRKKINGGAAGSPNMLLGF